MLPEFRLNAHRSSRYTRSWPVARHPSVDAMQSEWVPRTVLEANYLCGWLIAPTPGSRIIAWALGSVSGALPSLGMRVLQLRFRRLQFCLPRISRWRDRVSPNCLRRPQPQQGKTVKKNGGLDPAYPRLSIGLPVCNAEAEWRCRIELRTRFPLRRDRRANASRPESDDARLPPSFDRAHHLSYGWTSAAPLAMTSGGTSIASNR